MFCILVDSMLTLIRYKHAHVKVNKPSSASVVHHLKPQIYKLIVESFDVGSLQ